MSVKIRLQRHGRKKAPFYHIVIADSRSPRDGRFIEKLGTYNPLTVPATIELERDRAYYWVSVGAQPTETVAAILRLKGVFFMKHQLMGVAKGAITQEVADARIAEFLQGKDGSMANRRDEAAKQKENLRLKLDGVMKVKEKPAPPVEEVEAAAEEAVEAATEEAVEAIETVVEEAAAPVEAPAEEVAAPAEAPAAPAAEETAE
jgi:small subunit ribosomal protein S16